MADEKEEKNKEEGREPAKGGNKKIFVFSGAGLAALIAAAFLFATFAVPTVPEEGNAGTEGKEKEARKTEEEHPPLVYALPSIMVNIKGTNKKQILKVTLNLVCRTDKPEETTRLIDEKKVEIKNALNIMLTGKTREELEGSEEMSMLAVEIRDLLNKVIFPGSEGLIRKVLYDEFIIQ